MDGKEIELLSSAILLTNTQFFFNEVVNLGHLRSTILKQRAQKRLQDNDFQAAATDSNEALNYDCNSVECYLLKARAENLRAENMRTGISRPLTFYKLYLSMGKQCAEFDKAMEEYTKLKKGDGDDIHVDI